MAIKDSMEIQEQYNYTQTQFEDLKQLMSELSERVNFAQTDLKLVLKDSNFHLHPGRRTYSQLCHSRLIPFAYANKGIN